MDDILQLIEKTMFDLPHKAITLLQMTEFWT